MIDAAHISASITAAAAMRGISIRAMLAEEGISDTSYYRFLRSGPGRREKFAARLLMVAATNLALDVDSTQPDGMVGYMATSDSRSVTRAERSPIRIGKATKVLLERVADVQRRPMVRVLADAVQMYADQCHVRSSSDSAAGGDAPDGDPTASLSCP